MCFRRSSILLKEEKADVLPASVKINLKITTSTTIDTIIPEQGTNFENEVDMLAGASLDPHEASPTFLENDEK